MAPRPAGATARLSSALHARARAGAPEPLVATAGEVLLDALSCLFAGSAEQPSRYGRDYVAEVGGHPEASVVGLVERVDAASAAFANGVAVHALDFEPIGSPPCHASATVLPAVLALAERSGATGHELITAFALGWEVECRLRVAGRLRADFHPMAVYGPVAAAAAGAVLLRLDARGIESAIAIGASAAGGLAANGHTPVKVVHAGSAARSGVVAALQARHGLIGAAGVLERRGGYGDAFFADVDWATIDRMGEGPDAGYFLTAEGVVHKPYPVQLPLLNVIDTVLDARPSGFDLAAFDALELVVSPLVASRSNPRPERGHAGKFSLEYCAAAALVFGDVGIDTFDDSSLSDPRIVHVIDRIAIVEESAADPHAVTVRLHGGGGVHLVHRTHQRGSAAVPLSREQRVDKARRCLAHVGAPGIADELVARVDELANAPDVSRLASLLRIPLPGGQDGT